MSLSFLPGGHNHFGHMTVGLWCLAGLFGFLALEKLFMEQEKEDKPSEKSSVDEKNEHEKGEKVASVI